MGKSVFLLDTEKGLETFFILDYTLEEDETVLCRCAGAGKAFCGLLLPERAGLPEGGTSMGKNVTIVQIAKECGVSVATVSRVLNGTAPVSEEKRSRIQEAMSRHHYSPNAFARGLVSRQSMTLGVLIPDITNPYFSSMFTELEAAAQEAGYSLLLCNTAFSATRAGEKTKRETDYFRTMVDKRVDGVLIVGGQADLNAPGESYRAALRELCEALPVVVLGNPIPGVNCRFIQRERGRGVFASVSYLSGLGHRRIAFVGGEDGVDITLERLAAYRQALAVLGLPEDESLVALSDYYAPDGFAAANRLLARKTEFTAILAMNDNVAVGVYRALADAGLKIPRDVSVISCDQFFTAEYMVPRLTSVDQHNALFGQFVIKALLSAMSGGRENVLLRYDPELIIRESCMPPAEKRK